MKTNAIVRIVLYSIVILLLLGILLIGLSVDLYTFSFHSSSESGEPIYAGFSFDAGRISKIDIDWAAGSVYIKAGEPLGAAGDITVLPSEQNSSKYQMTYAFDGDTLKLSYTNSAHGITFGSIPPQNISIFVPEEWICEELEIDGAALELTINGMTIGALDIDGADCKINLNGSVDTVECDGAACDLTLVCANSPRQIDLDGAACELDLTLPENCGFLVQMNGLSCNFSSDQPYSNSNGDYFYGDRYCKVSADGIACNIRIHIQE